MSATVIEVGPSTVRGCRDVDADTAATALDCIDDHLALIDDQPVPVDRLWREVLTASAATMGETVVLVCPT